MKLAGASSPWCALALPLLPADLPADVPDVELALSDCACELPCFERELAEECEPVLEEAPRDPDPAAAPDLEADPEPDLAADPEPALDADPDPEPVLDFPPDALEPSAEWVDPLVCALPVAPELCPPMPVAELLVVPVVLGPWLAPELPEAAVLADFGGGGITWAEKMESSATGQFSLRPDALGAFVGFMLFAPLERVALFALPALHGGTDGFRALRRVLPILSLGIALGASADDVLVLLMERFVETCEKRLEIACRGTAHASLRAGCEVAHVAFAIIFELCELLLTFLDAPLAGGERFGLAALEVVDDLLHHLESFTSFHELRSTFPAGRSDPLQVAALRAGRRTAAVIWRLGQLHCPPRRS